MKNTTRVIRVMIQEPERMFKVDDLIEQTGLTRNELKMAIHNLCTRWKFNKRKLKGKSGKDTIYWINLEKEKNILKMLNRPLEDQ